MKTFKKVLCVMLSLLMALSCLTVAASAAGEEKFTASFRLKESINNTESAKITLDELDEILASLEDGKGIYFEVMEGIAVDLRSVTALCGTLDLLRRVLVVDNIFDVGTTAALKLALGQLGKDINLKNWQTGMSRPNDDIAILRGLIGFLGDNRNVLSGIINGGYDMGVVSNFVDIDELLGEGGVGAMLKEALIGMAYDKDSAEFDAAYTKYENDIDSFVYSELITSFTEEYLPGFTVDASSTIETLLMDVYNISFEQYIKKALTELDVDFSDSEYEELRKLGEVVNLDGSTYDLSGLTYVKGTSLKNQINTILGNYIKNLVPSYTGWVKGGYENLDANIENAIKYVASKTGIIENATVKTVEEIGIEIALIIIQNGDFGTYEDGLADCENIEQMATVLLMNTAREMEIGVEYKGDESYLVVLGDMLASYLQDYFPLKDVNGESCYPGSGRDVFEVMNCLFNYFLFDREGAAVLGITTTKNEDAFTKLDKLIDYFGKNKSVNFSLKNFLFGTANKKGIFDCLFTLDIGGFVDMTAIPALDKAGNVSAVEFIYRSAQYFCNNWAGAALLPEYKTKAFTNALSDSNIANLVNVLLATLGERKASVVTLLTYLAGILIGEDKQAEYTIDSAVVSDTVATGRNASPKATVKVGGKELVQGRDYKVIVNPSAPGKATAVIKGKGIYSGEITREVNLTFDSVKTVRYTATSTSIVLSWPEVAYADGYEVFRYNVATGKNDLLATVKADSFTDENLTPNTAYTYTVQAVSGKYGESQAKTVEATTAPVAINASTVNVVSAVNAIKFAWTAVPGATAYMVEQYLGSNTWKKIATVTSPVVTAKSLLDGTTYYFRVTALKNSGGTTVASAPVTLKFRTTLAAPATFKATYAEKAITLSWSAVRSAESYIIRYYTGSAWKILATVKGTTYVASGLTPAREYNFSIQATSSAYASTTAKTLKAYTLPSAVVASKVNTASSASAIKLAWTAVSGATHYKVEQYLGGGKWKAVAGVAATSYTVTGLASYTSYYFRITALKKLSNGSYLAAAPSANIKATTTLGTPATIKTSYTSSSVTLTWSKVTNAYGYQVYTLVNGAWKLTKTVTGTTYTATKLKAATKYSFLVRAIAKNGSKWIYGANKGAVQYTGIAKPATVKLSKVTANAATITWSKVAKATGYQVYAYIGGKWVAKATTGTSLTVTGLPSGQSTIIKVRAYTKLGGKVVYGDYSANLSALTLVGKVTGLKIAERSPSSIKFTWTKTTGAASYEVYRYTGGKWVKIGTTTATNFTDKSGLKRNTQYIYMVRAVQKVNSKTVRYGAYSDQLSAKTTLVGGPVKF